MKRGDTLERIRLITTKSITRVDGYLDYELNIARLANHQVIRKDLIDILCKNWPKLFDARKSKYVLYCYRLIENFTKSVPVSPFKISLMNNL